MDTVVYDRIEDVLGRIESLYGRVEDTYLVAKDILLGTQISDWIADLKASGTASATYSDATRMNALIANEDAANNSDVAKYLVQWAVANNKYGTYCGAACGAVSGVTWGSLTTPNAVAGNGAAFTALCENSVAFYASMSVQTFRQAVWSNLSVTDTIIRTSSVAMNVLKTIAGDDVSWRQDYDIQGFIISITIYNSGSYAVSITTEPGSTVVTKNAGYEREISVNRFASKIDATTINGGYMKFVDFS